MRCRGFRLPRLREGLAVVVGAAAGLLLAPVARA